MDSPYYVCGTVTNVFSWHFIRYDGANWTQSEPLNVKDREDKDDVKRVMSNIYNINYNTST